MKSSRVDLSLKDDTRAVAPLVGFILLFGILVIAFTGYQAQVVPQQNAETEFEHFQQNHNEMIELRSAILTAGTSDRPQFPTIKLGTNYQTRILAVNGPPPAGLLQTSDPYPITISDGEEEVVIQTRFLEYQPGYNELDVGSTWYENSVLYLDELESSGGLVVIEDQNLVTDGDRLRITALQNNFQRGGTDRITLELYPTTSADGNLSDLDENAELDVTLPTRLDNGYWESQFEDSSSVVYDEVDESAIESGVNLLKLSVTGGVEDIELNTVGIREEPTEGSVKDTSSTRDENGGEEGTEVNPAGPEDVRLVGVDSVGGGTVTLTFRNDGEDTSIDSGRVGFYTGSGEDIPNEVTISVPSEEDTRATWTIGDGFSPLEPPILLDGGEDTEVEYNFDQNYNTNQDFFVTTLDLDNDQRGTYFVGGEYDPDDRQSGDNGNNGGGGTEYYPDNFDINSGNLNNFENMQNEDGEVAEFRRVGGDDFDIDIITNNVPTGEYVLEIKVDEELSGGRVYNIEVTGRQDGQLAVDEIEEGDETVIINLDSVTEEQDITVNYAAEGNDDLDIDYQRIEQE